jgi:nucleolar protein 56
LRYFLIVTEFGLLLIDELKEKVVDRFKLSSQDRTKRFLEASSGELSDEQVAWLKTKLTGEDVVFVEPQLIRVLLAGNLKAEPTSENDSRELSKKKIELIVSSGLASSPENVQEAIRDTSIEISNLRIKELSAKPDLQAMESVQALDEIDKTANIISSRVREWYGLHFPELVSMIDDNISLIKLILSFKSRENYDENELEQMGYSKNKGRAIALAAKESRGADIREEDLDRVIQLAEEAQHLFSVRDKLANHVEKTMRQIAPNVSELAGASIGARLIARAGGLEKLAILPSSTIQILGAEKALYRALKSGSRPPKHGILFQHAAVHSAPKWQRGKIARSIAGKIAIAARIDLYRGTKDPAMEESFASRLNEIKVKYKEAPRETKQFVPQRFQHEKREFVEARDRGRRGSGGSRRRDRVPEKRRDEYQRKDR